MQITAKAPAKINITLDILSQRPDGYHNVDMLMQAVSLYDEITVTADPKAQSEGEITITCNKEGVPCDSSNTAYKAAKAFFAYTNLTHGDMTIHIEKTIPFGAGLAGGSADGAAVIVILNRMYDARLTEAELCKIGEKVGADVPFCIVGGTRRATETGTTLSKLPKLPACKIVICKPEVSISTAKAYALADSRTGTRLCYTDLAVKALYSASVRNVADFLHNDFEEVLSLDVINSIKSVMYRQKALGCAMSGSGSAVFALFISERKASKCAQALKNEYEDVFVAEPCRTGVVISKISFDE